MAGDDDEVLTITIDDPSLEGELGVKSSPEKREPDVSVVEKPGQAEKAPAASDDPLESLKGQFATLKADRDQVVQRLAEQTQIAHTERQRAEIAGRSVLASQMDAVATGISSAEAEISAAKVAHQAAFDAGDAKGMIDATERLADATSRRNRLNEAKDDLEHAARAQQQPAPRQQAVPQQPDDPVEAYVRGRTAPTAKWLRDHPDYVTDQTKNAKLTAAHFDAVASRLQPDTQEYFDHVEEFVGLKKKAQPKPEVRQQRRPAAPATPVGHTGGGTTGTTSFTVELNSKERAAATDGTHVWNYDDPKGAFKKGEPIGIREFARRKGIMQREGRYDRTFTDQ